MSFVQIGVDQAPATSLMPYVRTNPRDAVRDQENHFDPGKYLSAVLGGASPLDIFDHGIGPFEDKTLRFHPTNYGVLCIENFPYDATKFEVEHLLGRNAAMLAPREPGCPIHIIMERSTSKTMNCYVEFRTQEAAVDAHRKFKHLGMSCKSPRIGPRFVEVDLSDQDKFLEALFPKARGLVWENGVPRKIENTDPYSAGFQGFLTREEIIGLHRHAEMPQRSPYSVKCLQRTYECMISTLWKFPWHAQHMFTLEDRSLLFDNYVKQLDILVQRVDEAQTIGLDTKLLIEFVTAGLHCAGFGERMRYTIAARSGKVGESFGISTQSDAWPFDVLSIPAEAGDGGRWLVEHCDCVEFLIYLITLGYHESDGDYIHSDIIEAEVAGPPVNPGERAISAVKFKFTDDVLDLSYVEIVGYEVDLARQMLHVGFEKWQNIIRVAWREGKFGEHMQNDVSSLATLQQMFQLCPGFGQMTLSESPEGTVVGEEEEEERMTTRNRAGDDDPNFYRASNTTIARIDPTVAPFEPYARRNSEPSMVIPHEDITTPVRAESDRDLTSGSVSPGIREHPTLGIHYPDEPTVFTPVASRSARTSPFGPIGGQRADTRRSPIRPRHTRGSFSVGQTILEEHESDEEIMMGEGRPRRSTNAEL